MIIIINNFVPCCIASFSSPFCTPPLYPYSPPAFPFSSLSPRSQLPPSFSHLIAHPLFLVPHPVFSSLVLTLSFRPPSFPSVPLVLHLPSSPSPPRLSLLVPSSPSSHPPLFLPDPHPGECAGEAEGRRPLYTARLSRGICTCVPSVALCTCLAYVCVDVSVSVFSAFLSFVFFFITARVYFLCLCLYALSIYVFCICLFCLCFYLPVHAYSVFAFVAIFCLYVYVCSPLSMRTGVSSHVLYPCLHLCLRVYLRVSVPTSSLVSMLVRVFSLSFLVILCLHF